MIESDNMIRLKIVRRDHLWKLVTCLLLGTKVNRDLCYWICCHNQLPIHTCCNTQFILYYTLTLSLWIPHLYKCLLTNSNYIFKFLTFRKVFLVKPFVKSWYCQTFLTDNETLHIFYIWSFALSHKVNVAVREYSFPLDFYQFIFL